MASIAAIIGRILLAIIFIVSGVTKLMTVGATESMITGAGLPSGLAVPTGVFELIAGVLLAIGLMTRLAAILLAGFTLLATVFFHTNFADPMQSAMALKNLAITGGLLLVFAHSQLWYGWDRVRRDRRAEIAERDAATRVHDAEVRAARAEGTATARDTVVVKEPVTRDRVVAGDTVRTADDVVVTDPAPRRKWF
jgi:putative oxidoreductase